VDAVVHFAAKTFVDYSIRDVWPFLQANVIGTYNLLEDARKYGVKRYIQIGTDEVYGAIKEGAYKEDARLNPTNPYSATKAGADCLALCYANTYGLHTTVTRTENNYGPMQGMEKAIPVFVRAALKGEPLPVYGDGKHRRMWLWVEDHIDALLLLLKADYPPGEIFHIAGEQEIENLELAKHVLRLCGKPEDQIRFVDEFNVRRGHDRRYSLDCTKLRTLGWTPKVSLERGLDMAVSWYRFNSWWLE
jgi:dTDP-glucose 4,6-dehydratase